MSIPAPPIGVAIIDSGVPYTVLRPVAFYENFNRQQQRFVDKGMIDSRAPDRLLHFIGIRSGSGLARV